MKDITISEVIDKAIQREEAAYAFYMELFDQIEVIDDDWFETGSTLQPSVEIFIDVEEY